MGFIPELPDCLWFGGGRHAGQGPREPWPVSCLASEHCFLHKCRQASFFLGRPSQTWNFDKELAWEQTRHTETDTDFRPCDQRLICPPYPPRHRRLLLFLNLGGEPHLKAPFVNFWAIPLQLLRVGAGADQCSKSLAIPKTSCVILHAFTELYPRTSALCPPYLCMSATLLSQFGSFPYPLLQNSYVSVRTLLSHTITSVKASTPSCLPQNQSPSSPGSRSIL